VEAQRGGAGLSALDKVYLKIRHPKAFEVTRGETQGFDHLRGHKYALLTTFRRSGEAVPTPVWFGVGDDGNVYVRSEADVGKVKRIRANGRALVAPSDARGKPKGPAAEGRARVLPPSEHERAERAIAANYGFGRKVYEGVADRLNYDLEYLEIAPGEASPADARP
jgi:PPOX class probable F420-dependent enzyme